MEVLELSLAILGRLIGWSLSRFRAWIDRLPDRDPAELPLMQRFGRLVLAATALVAVVAPLAWVLWG
ncbi:hypothetical protein JQ557_15475 [Bradyrhizobium sp. U87765 SZCCT0131]|uniref:hypothetical protein n=1 Tax=unclassified Bradyrhizobium TaxID=2631580 RepID=UPI001BA4DE38|nr:MULTISPECIES: hypothetical protein [unclassified Bradyrhizobium]MBR1219403.1 hypothetical protein [Bradyrhizobium sp. U87765 SZCCT0131]MBR1262054.1 hypothetical protein [Bradyrhizobium sp. U87765 SZCCT0134]MBR1306093.1 hypothetical protein [Bradyrhizobium sp. U87765 SZCCT0110]MBR1317836.1 hypothetical protein [Bradyrhizobium sp. U87765 SZCCT0109]MBR1351538.1 hypothetical protein [Bradyrhizobium sp. U87765 SZCCT0048]